MGNLRQVSIAILEYASANDGRMPPPFTTNQRGDRLHSWRSLILPFLDLDDLYASFDLTLPWNDPAHLAIAAQTPDVFRSPGIAGERTRICAVIGEDTLWPANTT